MSNTRFAVRDAQAIAGRYLAPGGVKEVHLYHPQPYNDPSKAGRRLVTPRFLADVHRALSPKGLFVVQTDNPDYWAYMQRVIPEFFDFRARKEPWPDAPEGRSRREILARSRDLKIFRAEAFRREDLSADEAIRKAERLPPPTFLSRGPWCDLDALEARGIGADR